MLALNQFCYPPLLLCIYADKLTVPRKAKGRSDIVRAIHRPRVSREILILSSETYIIFIALQCISVPLALALSPPEKVDSLQAQH